MQNTHPCCCNHLPQRKYDFDPNELIVWKKPNVSQEAFDSRKAYLLSVYPDIHISFTCGDCDHELELWEGTGIQTFVADTGLKAGGSGGNTVNGDDAVAYYFSNIIFDLPFPTAGKPDKRGQYDNERNPNPYYLGPIRNGFLPGDQSKCTKPAITLAVLDTGLAASIRQIYKGKFGALNCSPGSGSETGWNFVAGSSATDDDNHGIFHGSTVSTFIINEILKYANHKINLIPVKVHDHSGRSSLIHVLCALAYASNNGAQIINASFGFYWADVKPPEILVRFIKKYLVDKGIVLVAAAGNKSNDDDAFSAAYPTLNPRHLDDNPFYPAYLSKDLDNVITVTTVSQTNNNSSPTQNFSNDAVDIGVNCDVVCKNLVTQQFDYGFVDPLERGKPIIGSSYATPVVSGMICAFYSELVDKFPNGKIDKALILQKMQGMGIIQQDEDLNQYVRNGLLAKK